MLRYIKLRRVKSMEMVCMLTFRRQLCQHLQSLNRVHVLLFACNHHYHHSPVRTFSTPCSIAIHNMFAYHAIPSDMAYATNQDIAIEGAAKQLSRSSPRGPNTAEDVL